ncbi:hypothetical protein [Streptomyces sp. NPDC056987]|uniref:hypothetical protein n=1 Tax=Streptomyces sp. NPDC056987 TaxID=3345988 RepID=UPI003625CE36
MGGPLHKYRYRSPASGVETVLKLNDADAARLGLTEDDRIPDTTGLRGEHGPQLLSLPDTQEPDAGPGDGQEQEPAAGDDPQAAAAEPPADVKAAPPARNKARTTAATAATKTAGRRRKPADPDADPAVDATVAAGATPAGDNGGDGGTGGGD